MGTAEFCAYASELSTFDPNVYDLPASSASTQPFVPRSITYARARGRIACMWNDAAPIRS